MHDEWCGSVAVDEAVPLAGSVEAPDAAGYLVPKVPDATVLGVGVQLLGWDRASLTRGA